MDLDLDLTGRRVGRYEIRSLLGSGGMGAVYRAYDSNLDRHVAVKILPPQLVTDAERVRRFVQEAKSASALNHPHVISIYEIGEDDSLHYIAMELVEGATLRHRISGGALELKRALVIGEQIAEAIGAAHEAGVVHRDLKPENIIIASSGYVKVLDFGLAKLRRETSAIGGDAATEVKSTEPGRILGTVGYMSPEQAEGKPVDHRSDIFSLGCILYEMVSGRSPFRGRSAVETLHNIVHGQEPPLAGPAELQRIISKALAKDPDERYHSAKDLAIDLKRLLREIDSSATVTTDYGIRPRRSRAWLWIPIAAVLAVLSVLFVLFRPKPSPTPPTPLTIKRITATGNVPGAAISPDGKYVAYVNSEQNRHSLHLRQLATGQDLQLVPPAEGGYWGHAFARDGASIYYALKSRNHPKGTLYSISILGGTPRRLLDGIDSAVSFSPDGKKITYVRGEPPPSAESALVVANADGSDVRVLAKRTPPQLFYPIFYTGPAWSPDGKTIAVSERTRDTSALIAVDVASGAARAISTGWTVAQQVAWLPDGNGLILIGARVRGDPQVWRVESSSGEARPITNDLLGYRMPTLTADGSTIVAVTIDRDADLWRIPLAGSEAPRRIRGGRGAGGPGLDVGPDGSIAYTSMESGTLELWVAGADGASARQLTKDSEGGVRPSFTPDGKTIVFGRYNVPSIQRIAADGSETRPTRITERAFEPALSPDGKTVVFRALAGLMKMPLAGGPAVKITDLSVQFPAISPDGTRVAGYCQPPGQPLTICIFPMAGGPPQPVESAGPNSNSVIRWVPDGKALLINTMPEDRRNVWRLPLDGSAPAALTQFTDQLMFSFDLTPDGKALIASRGELTRDAVMITGFR
ncbi:MAG TPA: protein kinase [Thermoanaerobaculia bacterium]|nr:protein kinase [Thermoanaerobaculia bacterium]